jgi:diguanylate cyclase (GGDEF)-like protein
VSSLDYSQPADTRFRYRLLGLDEHWVSLPASARWATFANLAPGRYRLEVQGSNREGVWSPQLVQIEVAVHPLWWQTLWARGAAALAVVIAAWLLVRWWLRLRTRRLWRRQRELETRVQERTRALEAATQALSEQSRQLEAISMTDPLTGMHNRRYLEQQLLAEVPLIVRRHEDHPPASAAPAQEDLVFFVLDVDHFKRINDTHGHAAGDRVLMEIRHRLDHVLRASDYRVRWGGEEFLFVARGLPRSGAAELAERACLEVEALPFAIGTGLEVRLTCSIGFAAFPLAPQWPRALDWRQVVDLADAALYEAKRAGRNAWVGLLRAEAESEEQLREDAQRGLTTWMLGGRLQQVRRS